MGKIKIVLKMKKILWSMRKMAFKWMKSKKLPNWYMDDLNLIIKQRGENRIFENINQSSFQSTQIEKIEPNTLSSNIVNERIVYIPEQYGDVFCNDGFELFEHILSEYIKPKNTNGRYEDLSYFYRCLFDDNFIHQKPEPFRIWFMKKYTEEFSKIKTKEQTRSYLRKKNYALALDWFKSKNK
jgi:hypothetical protein